MPVPMLVPPPARSVPRWLRTVVLAAGYALASLALLWRDFLGHATFFGGDDASQQSYPWLVAVARAARHGRLVLWDFGVQAGTSFAGELQPAPFYPVTWLLGLLGLDGVVLCDAFVLVHFALAATAMHLLARTEGLSRPAAVLAAVLFAFCGYVAPQASGQPNIFASLCWLPLVILLYRRAFRAGRAAEAVFLAGLAGLAGAMQIAAGHLQPFVHSSYAALICAVTASLSARGRPVRPVLLVLFGQAMAAGLAAVPLDLAQQYLHLVYRWYATGMSRWPHAVPFAAYAAGAALTWQDLPGLLRPGGLRMMGGSLYPTLVGLGLCLASLGDRSVPARSMWLLALFALALSLGGHAGPLVHLFFHLPLLPQLRTPVRGVYLFSFAAALLAAIGLDRVGQAAGRRRPRTGRVAALALLGLALAELGPVLRRIGVPDGRDQYAPVYYTQAPALLAIRRLSDQGPLLDRFYALPGDLVPPNAGDIVPVLNLMGQRATMLVPFYDYLSQGWDPAHSPQMDRLGVRWLVAAHPVAGLEVVARGPGFTIQRRPQALSVLWIRGPGPSDRRPAPVEAVEWGVNRVRFRLGAMPGGTRLVFAQARYPGWEARIDGRKVAIGSEEIFDAVTLPAGARELVFAYRPSPWRAMLVTLLCAVVLGASGWWSGRRESNPPR